MAQAYTGEPFAVMKRQPLDFFKLIPQEGVQHQIFEDCQHNASYDILETKSGRVFFSQCAELGISTYMRLYEYLPATNEAKLCFRLEDVTFQQDDAIRPSKIHTSLAEMNDGRLIMGTHTTSQSPLHPAWMPYSFYRHQFEGFQGANIIMYDPNTGAIEHRGIPVPFESIYGGAYDRKYNAYYFSGMMRNHCYRFDIETNEVKDLGQLSEYCAYKLSTGPDGHIYSSTKMGRMFRINVDEQRIEDLGLQLPLDFPDSSYTNRMQIGHCAWHQDGRLYCCIARHPHLFRFDPKKMALEDLGDASTIYKENPAFSWPTGIMVDRRGIVWYGVGGLGRGGVAGGVRLYSYNPVTEEKQEWGFIGSTKRALHIVSELDGHGDFMYVLDSNHALGSCGVLAVDLTKMTAKGRKNAPYTNDVGIYMSTEEGRDTYPYSKDKFDEDAALIIKGIEEINASVAAAAENPDTFEAQQAWTYKLWQRIGTEHSQVRELHWQDNATLTGVCRGEEGSQAYTFTITDQKLTKLEPLENYEEQKPDLSAYDGLALPCIRGRQYKAVATAAVELADGSSLVGTLDAMAAIVKDGKVFSLGQAAPYGPIVAFATDDERRRVYGIASYPKDLGMIFSYDMETGLKQEGRVFAQSSVPDYFADSSEPSAVAVSPDGKYLAVGVKDRLGMVYIYRLK